MSRVLDACAGGPRARRCAADLEGDLSAAAIQPSNLTLAQRRTRAGLIRDTAARAGLPRAGWLLAGLADAETQMSHCWSELTWACQGPYAADCRGPVVAGAGDGPCSARQGGLGMFQFDGGDFNATLRRDGARVLTLTGNTQAAVEFTLRMVRDSAYVPGVTTLDEAAAWMNGVTPDNDRFHLWVQTVTHHYNGCLPGYSCFPQRYRHYRDHARGVWSEMGAGFWQGMVAPPPTPPDVSAQSLAVEWTRGIDGTYQFRAQAPAAVTRVEYRVDGWSIGTAARAASPSLAISYAFQRAVDERTLEVLGFDAQGAVAAFGVGLLDVTPDYGIFVRPTGPAQYEVGIERAPAGVAGLEVRADGFLLRDEVSGVTRSPRAAVRHTFSQLGPRDFELRTFNADGSARGVLRRRFTLRDEAAPRPTPASTGAAARTLSGTPYRYQYANAYDPAGTCGITSASMVLGHHGVTVSPDQLHQRFGVAQGQSPGGLVGLYRAYGLHGVSTYSGTFEQLRRFIDDGLPVVVHGDFTPSGHIVVVVGYDADGFIVHDPSGRWDGAVRGSYAGRTPTNGRFVRYARAALDRVIGPSGRIWRSVASRTPL
ncbi:MAG: C39 family peptidase [Polyangiales bacterium]